MAEKEGVNAMAQAASAPVSGSKLDNRRVLAAIIDLVVVGAGWAVIMAAGGVLGEPASEVGTGLFLVGLGWALYYYFACESGGGQTLGKRVMKIRVASLDGGPADMREVALRTVLRVIDGLFFYLVGLIVMIATGERRGRLGDLVGGTKIVSAEEPARAAAPVSLEATPEAPRIPIAESGPAFAAPAAVEEAVEPAPTVVAEPEPEPEAAEEEPVEVEEPVAEAEPEPEAASDEDDEPEAAEPEPEPAVYDISDAEPLAEQDEAAEPEVASPSLVELASDVSSVTEDPDREVEEEEDEPAAAEAEEDPKVTVKSVETVSAIDLVMQDAEEEEPSAKARQS
jgi:uncharacterized RDD family membrane protein YckC